MRGFATWLRNVALSEDLDLYLLILVSGSCTALGLLGVVEFPIQVLVAILLALIALLALSQVRGRIILRRIGQMNSGHQDPRFLRVLPPNIDELRSNSADLLMIGGAQVRQVYALRRCLSTKLASGHRIRIAFLDPAISDAINGENSGQGRRIRSSIEDLSSVSSSNSDQLQIRLLRTPPSFGYTVLSDPNGGSQIILQHRGWKTGGEGSPVFMLTENADFEWFRQFKAEAERIWQDATPIQNPGNLD